MSENETKPRRISVLAILSILLFLPAIGLTAMDLQHGGTDFLKQPPITAYTLWAVAPLFGIGALIVIARSNGRLRGRIGAGFVATISFLVLGWFAFGTVVRAMYLDGSCTGNLGALGRSMAAYAQSHDGALPDADRWCDILKAEGDTLALWLVCWASDTKRGESSYAMNSAAAGSKLSELPGDMVLLFEAATDGEPVRDFPLAERQYIIDDNEADFYRKQGTMVCKTRWNQVGGIDKVDTSSHGGGCNILFASGKVEFVSTRRLPLLRWSTDETPSPANLGAMVLHQAVPVGIAVVALIFTGATVWRCYRQGAMLLVVVMALLATGVGFLCGVSAGFLYMATSINAGATAGVFYGFLAGVCYAVFVRFSSASIERRGDRWQYAIAMGMATGIIVSALVHLTLILVGEVAHGGLPMIAGMPFGILTGAILGMIAAAIIGRSLKRVTETRNA